MAVKLRLLGFGELRISPNKIWAGLSAVTELATAGSNVPQGMVKLYELGSSNPELILDTGHNAVFAIGETDDALLQICSHDGTSSIFRYFGIYLKGATTPTLDTSLGTSRITIYYGQMLIFFHNETAICIVHDITNMKLYFAFCQNAYNKLRITCGTTFDGEKAHMSVYGFA